MVHKADSEFIESVVNKLMGNYEGRSGINFIEVAHLPVRDKVLNVLERLFEVLFPGYAGKRSLTQENISLTVGGILSEVFVELGQQIENSLKYKCKATNCDTGDCHKMAVETTQKLFEKLSKIRELLKTDVSAAYDGDPAASSLEEIVISYPFIKAISTHRIAHELYLMEVPMIPRMMSEYAHQTTGIDINPGASIGEYFFIDHGTGVVIGETAVIGNHVQIYQGVTLGALAPAAGQRMRGRKRHPTIENNVVIYAEATILGDVTIGEGSVIGGNVSLKNSVPANTSVFTATPELVYQERRKRKKGKK